MLKGMVKKYLQHPDMLFRRVRDEFGQLHLSKRAAAYHPGRGVYRSSYKNARRLAATEINMAYRTADYLRWQDFDFVVGIEINLSSNHTCLGADGKPHPFEDICDELAGCYPKDFKFTGWHPHCRCYATTILKTEKKMAEDDRRILNGEEPINGSKEEISKLPPQYNAWIEKNSERIDKATSFPYFLNDNLGVMSGKYLEMAVVKTRSNAIRVGHEVQGIAEEVAKKYNARCTPINFKSEASIMRKVLSERADIPKPTFRPSELKDTVRTTIVANRKDIKNILSELQSIEGFARIKEQRTSMGYTGNIVNIRTNIGLIAEIQVNTPEMIYAKESPDVAKSIIGVSRWNKIHRETGLEGGLGHKYYEQWRVLDPQSKEAKITSDQSREYYKHFTT